MTSRSITISIMLLIMVIIICMPAIAATPMRLIGMLKGSAWADRLGDACEGLGDINGDGYNDFLIASYGPHDLRLYLGGPHPFDVAPTLVWHNHADDFFSSSFSPINIGDIDCDGVNDFASMFGDWDSLKIFKGLENLDADDYLLLPHAPYAKWGYPTGIWGGGDNNYDGNNELWVQSYRSLANDTVLGFSGCDLFDTIPDLWIRVPNDVAAGYEGIWNICPRCDLNGDGISDIIVGQPSGGVPSFPGRVHIFWGGRNLSQTADLIFHAPKPHPGDDMFGADLDCLGDISGDGVDDLWVSQGGRNYIFFGGQPFDTFPDVTLDWSYMYIDMENVGDINNDGWNDVALVMADYLINRISYIYCGPTMDTLVDAVYSDDDFYFAQTQGPVCCVGIDHSWAGDIDGDRIDDILLSARSTDQDEFDYGKFFIQAGWNGQPVDVGDTMSQSIMPELNLSQNRPNPFNSGTVMEFTLQRSGRTEIRIFNLLGEVVTTLLDANLAAGQHEIHWDGLDENGLPTPTGIYFYQIRAAEFSETKKMLLLK